MALRQIVNTYQPIVIGAVVLAVLVAIYTIVTQTSSDGPRPLKTVFFTVDDGATYFEDDVKKLPPFDKDGKQAVRCYVYECDSKKTVAYLERYTDELKAELSKLTVEPGGKLDIKSPPWVTMGKAQGMYREVKKPGEKAWKKLPFGGQSPQTAAPRCDDGSDPTPVLP